MRQILIVLIIIFSLVSLFFLSMNYKYNPNEKMQEKGYIGNNIKKVEIDNKYICFVLDEFRAISCLIKE